MVTDVISDPEDSEPNPNLNEDEKTLANIDEWSKFIYTTWLFVNKRI